MRNILVLILMNVCVCSFSQNRFNDVGKITIHATVPEREDLPEDARKLLQTKLSQIITASGVADDEYCVRFVLTAKINVLSKDVTIGPPPRISQNVEITLMIGDVEANKVYSQLSIITVGVGLNKEKAFISAINNLIPQASEVQTFMAEAKAKIVTFYQTECEDILIEARKLSNSQQYEDALLLLGSIPDVCKDCFSEAAQMTASIYHDMINLQGEKLLMSARTSWITNPNREGASEAVRLLSQINHAANCKAEIKILLDEISCKIEELDRREWEQQLEEYRNQKIQEEREWQQQLQEKEDSVEVQKQYIRACRDVAIARIKKQPKVIQRTINYNRIILW